MMQNGSVRRIGHPPSWIFKIKNFDSQSLERPILHHKLVEIGLIVAEILRFFRIGFSSGEM